MVSKKISWGLKQVCIKFAKGKILKDYIDMVTAGSWEQLARIRYKSFGEMWSLLHKKDNTTFALA